MRLWSTRPRTFVLPLLTAVALLAGCSTTDTLEQPAPVPDIDASVEFKTKWSMNVGDGHDGQFLHLMPLNAGERLYAVSADGQFVAVAPENGEVLWQYDLDEAIMAGVGGDGDKLYLVSRDARLLAYGREDGTPLWDTSLPNEVLAPPQSNGSIVVVQTTDGKVLAFDTASGDKRWQYDGVVPVLSLRATAAPLVGSELVLASFANGRLLALASDTGQPLWQYTVGEPQGRTELERLVDIAGQPLVLENAVLVAGYQGKLALVDLRNGQEIWSRSASSLHSPMIGDGKIFVSSANGDIVAYHGSSRREAWTQDQLAWRQTTQPLVVDGYLLVGDYEGYLHALSLEDGALKGQTRFDRKGLRVPMQLLREGVLVYGNGGKLAVLELKERN